MNKALLTAAIAGIMASAAAVAAEAPVTEKAPVAAVAAEKNGCKAVEKNKCTGKTEKHKCSAKAEKHKCKTKNGCKTKAAK
jgi:hypothetical protein